MLTALATADDVKDWPSKPSSKAAYASFDNTIRPRLKNPNVVERATIKREIIQFLEDQRWKNASFYSCAILSVPPELLNASMGAFLVGLGIYLGSVWAKDLDPVAGRMATRAVLICYIVVGVVGLARFFGANHGKDAGIVPAMRWTAELEDDGVETKGEDVEQGSEHVTAEGDPKYSIRSVATDQQAMTTT
ncbi:hypothetical protein CC78DRAFT_536491 [Lojkania enalia]|uniref:Uncharacterized protein n=1 Tax=Lojkania enalia TaxID=147567 RepID=A0A9P4K2W9_9PLEO|nr:hypothetical protein CC78DRAFT_536491 [Didymosphaeria enalia]